MGLFIAVIAVLTLFFSASLLSRITYPFRKSGDIPVTDWIVTRGVRHIFSLLRTYAGFRFIKDEGNFSKLPEQFIVLSNHQSLIDIPMYMDYFDGKRLRFFAKAELGSYVPVISLVLRRGKHCLLKRKGNPRNDMKSVDVFSWRVKQYGWNPVLFPEGTRSRDGSLGKFHRAGFRRTMDKAPLPVAVCAIDGSWEIATVSGILKNITNGGCRVRLLEVFPAPATKEEQITVLEKAHTLISDQLHAWRNEKK